SAALVVIADAVRAPQMQTAGHRTLSSTASTPGGGHSPPQGGPGHPHGLVAWGVLTTTARTLPVAGVGGSLPETLRCGGSSTPHRPTGKAGSRLAGHDGSCRPGALREPPDSPPTPPASPQ